jgi:transcriptional regulator with XRE-family HTH domain
MLTPREIKAARVYLDWTQDDLADRSNLSVATVRNIESGVGVPSSKSIEALDRALSEYVDFLPNGGFQPKSETMAVLKGRSGFIDFIWDVHNVVKASGGEICVSNVDEKDFLVWLGEEEAQKYKDAMATLDNEFFFKILIREGDDYFAAGKYAEYRWVPEQEFSNVPFYVYGDRLAILIFDKEASVYILKNKKIADAYRRQFSVLWNRAIKPQIEGRLK